MITNSFTPINKANNRASPTFSFTNVDDNIKSSADHSGSMKLFTANDNDDDLNDDTSSENDLDQLESTNKLQNITINHPHPSIPFRKILTTRKLTSQKVQQVESIPLPRCIGDIKEVSEQLSKLGNILLNPL